ncbi:MAG: hypothetical protein HWD63_15100 [Candidatus Parvibacillus calidus]|nr:MAG: hypothetical protein HWD63_15100 [Candidatus Parvibacillus calidus]
MINRLTELIWLRWPAVIVSLLLLSCKTEVKQSGAASNPFFQVSDYILDNYRRERSEKALFKTITINGQTDTLLLTDSLNAGETIIMDKLNLNNPDWIPKYKADTVFGVYGDADRYQYRALDEDLPVQSIEVNMEKGTVSNIRVRSRRRSLINRHDQFLTYIPHTGYRLLSLQRMWNGDTLRMEVSAEFRMMR